MGLDQVDNTSDLSKPISTATQNALNNKIDSVISSTTNTQIYTKTPTGTQAMGDVDVNATANTYPIRDVDSTINVGTPSSSSHATTKDYVDTQVATKQAQSTAAYSFGNASGSFTAATTAE